MGVEELRFQAGAAEAALHWAHREQADGRRMVDLELAACQKPVVWVQRKLN